MCVDRFHIVSLFLSNPCTPFTLSKEALVYFVCPTEIPQPPSAWKYDFEVKLGHSSKLQHTHTHYNALQDTVVCSAHSTHDCFVVHVRIFAPYGSG